MNPHPPEDLPPRRPTLPEGLEHVEPSADDIPAVIPVPPAALPPVRPAPPPRPGFWGALLWCLAFAGVMILTGVIGGVISLMVQLQAAPDRQAFMDKLSRAAAEHQITPELGAVLRAVTLAAEVGLTLFAFLIVRYAVGRDWARQLAVRLPRWDHLLLALVGLPALMFAHGAVHELVGRLAPAGQNAEDVGKLLGQIIEAWPRWLTVLVIGIAPGINEELFCRGFLGRGLLARYGIVGGVLLTSMFFGLLHGSLTYAVGTAFMGACLHFVYLTTRSLLVPMLLHLLNNSLTILLTLGDLQLPNVNPDAPMPPSIYAASALLVAAVGYALYQSRARLADIDPERPGWRPAYPGVSLPPADSGTVVVHEPPSGVAVALVVLAAGVFGAAIALA